MLKALMHFVQDLPLENIGVIAHFAGSVLYKKVVRRHAETCFIIG